MKINIDKSNYISSISKNSKTGSLLKKLSKNSFFLLMIVIN